MLAGRTHVITLARARTDTFGSRRKIILCCSPTVENDRISQAYEASDQRQAYVPCPDCGHFQTLEWSNVEWDNDLPTEERPATAYYRCEKCGSHWDDIARWNACSKMEWRASKPLAGIAGFKISHLASPWKTLGQLVADYLAAKHSRNREQLKAFYNVSLCKTWREEGTKPDEELLYARREEYPFNDGAVVPARGLFLVAGVDVQLDRLEVEVVAYGRGGESWSISYEVIEALDANGKRLSVQSPEVWQKLDAILKRQWAHELGGSMQIWLMSIDTGQNPKPVYQFALTHPQPSLNMGRMRVPSMGSVVCVKGTADEMKVIASISTEDAARKRHGVKIVGVGTVAVKSQLFDALRYITPDPDNPVPNACHFPDYPLEYFRGLCSEEKIITDAGKIRFEKRVRRNEALDARVYSIAAATVCGMDRFTEAQWAELEHRLVNQPQPVLPLAQPTPQIQHAPRRSDWIEPRRDWLR